MDIVVMISLTVWNADGSFMVWDQGSMRRDTPRQQSVYKTVRLEA